jgi:hypothetical protein
MGDGLLERRSSMKWLDEIEDIEYWVTQAEDLKDESMGLVYREFTREDVRELGELYFPDRPVEESEEESSEKTE